MNSKLTLFISLLIISSVAFDQSLILQPDAVDGKDAMIYDSYPDNNFGTYPNIQTEAWTTGGSAFLSRSFIGFSLAGLPANSTVTSAKLSLFYGPQGDGDPHSTLSGSNASIIERILDNWGENTVTWNNQPTTTPTNSVTLLASTSNTQDYINIDITSMVLDEIGEGGNEVGLMIRLETEAYYRRMVFGSSDNPDTTIHPMLVIEYTDFTTIDEQSSIYSIYPNPCNDKLQILTSQGDNNIIDNLQIYNAQGKLIKKIIMPTNEINVSELSPGLYIIKLSYGLKSENIRFVKS
ncbi:MAG: DNRLRE domain-containing protein [Crocinitomicaceae bacterium]|nr:DNRLRE domain-containing protein [Crocinitomicaceae bacterium]